ncbi:unannotated protein [freshwater metagenome]|uniref:Unannotated protein n=1 Tax=freshwater metagenome TaxID=449393 RepID=A0A6J7F1C5_9ZZZZ|nr:DNA processing protein DprA [Actinomycetota bacterium]
MQDDYMRRAAVVMSALELVPAHPSDLTHILRDSGQLELIGPAATRDSDLVRYLRDELEAPRVEHWLNEIRSLCSAGSFRVVLASSAPERHRYPPRLLKCWDAPPLLFASANDIPVQRSVAIIGSREVGHDIIEHTRNLASGLAMQDVTIVSGLARGVDAAAHEGALDAGGFTVAVLGTGITRVYPAENIGLAERIRVAGLLLSQFAPRAPRTRTSFLQRNHVIAGLSDVSIIMAGEARSGSRHEVRQAIGYGRPVFMWASALAHQRWARDLVNSGVASFFDDSEEIRSTLEGLSE